MKPSEGAVINTATPVISGTAEAGSTVTLSFDGTVAGTTLTDSTGAWSFTPSAPLSQGPHTVTVQATDAAGNTSAASSPSTWVVDSVSPGAPVVTAPAAGEVVEQKRPTITGTAEVGSTVTVMLDGAEIAVVAVSDTGAWSFTPTEDLAEGPHTVSARSTDAVGNPGPVSEPVAFTIDTQEPGGCGCGSSPGSAVGWGALVLGLACLCRRGHGPRWYKLV